MKALVKKATGPGFIALEAVIHIYLAAYLILNHAAVLAIVFILFELTMFWYLLITRQVHSHGHGTPECEPEKYDHLTHYKFCNCLGDSGTCCQPGCPTCKEPEYPS